MKTWVRRVLLIPCIVAASLLLGFLILIFRVEEHNNLSAAEFNQKYQNTDNEDAHGVMVRILDQNEQPVQQKPVVIDKETPVICSVAPCPALKEKVYGGKSDVSGMIYFDSPVPIENQRFIRFHVYPRGYTSATITLGEEYYLTEQPYVSSIDVSVRKRTLYSRLKTFIGELL